MGQICWVKLGALKLVLCYILLTFHKKNQTFWWRLQSFEKTSSKSGQLFCEGLFYGKSNTFRKCFEKGLNELLTQRFFFHVNRLKLGSRACFFPNLSFEKGQKMRPNTSLQFPGKWKRIIFFKLIISSIVIAKQSNSPFFQNRGSISFPLSLLTELIKSYKS